MAYLNLLLIAILTVASGATPLYYSDVQSPASGSGHNIDLSQVTTLQYCIIDNCTIMRIDIGQQLDIVYITESLLIVTPKDGHTSMMITRIDDEVSCLEHHYAIDDSRNTVHDAIIASLIMTVSIMYCNRSFSLQKSSYWCVWEVTNLLQSCFSDYKQCYHFPSINSLLDNSKFTSNMYVTLPR